MERKRLIAGLLGFASRTAVMARLVSLPPEQPMPAHDCKSRDLDIRSAPRKRNGSTARPPQEARKLCDEWFGLSE